MRRHFLVRTLVLVSVTTAAIAGFQYWHAPKRATNVAVEASRSLGLNLLAFQGPVRSGSFIADAEAFHWEQTVEAAVSERVTYLPSEQRLCWAQLTDSTWKDNGCISTAKYEN
jgi:hypothetical protein